MIPKVQLWMKFLDHIRGSFYAYLHTFTYIHTYIYIHTHIQT